MQLINLERLPNFLFSRYLFRKKPVEVQPNLDLEPDLNFQLKGIQAYFPRNPVCTKSRQQHEVEIWDLENSRLFQIYLFQTGRAIRAKVRCADCLWR
jgi:hypothetical protein